MQEKLNDGLVKMQLACGTKLGNGIMDEKKTCTVQLYS